MFIARMIESSQANGPGNRAVVWFQGCDARCPGCCNPEFQPMESDNALSMSPSELAKWFHDQLCEYPELRGLTLSGGEPLHPRQRDDLNNFLFICRSTAPRLFDVMAFTGYSTEQLLDQFGFGMNDLLSIDLLIAGPYERDLHNASGIVSSTNQNILRLSPAFDDVDDATLLNGKRIVEIRMANGTVNVTGLSSIEETLQILDLG